MSLHVDGRRENTHLFGERELRKMRPGSVLVNLSRGHIVDLEALAASLRAGHLAGAAVDVFPAEPNSNKEPFDTPLRGIPNVILTAHIGGSTAEAQQGIGVFVANRLVDHVNTGSTAGCVNLPEIALPPTPRAHRFLHLHRNQPGVLAEINGILARRRINRHLIDDRDEFGCLAPRRLDEAVFEHRIVHRAGEDDGEPFSTPQFEPRGHDRGSFLGRNRRRCRHRRWRNGRSRSCGGDSIGIGRVGILHRQQKDGGDDRSQRDEKTPDPVHRGTRSPTRERSAKPAP